MKKTAMAAAALLLLFASGCSKNPADRKISSSAGDRTQFSFVQDIESVFHSVDASLSIGSITVKSGESFRASCTYSHEKIKPELKVSDGTLFIRQPEKIRGLKSVKNVSCELVLEIPHSYTASGALTGLHLQSDLGNITVREIAVTGAELSCSAGQLRISGSSSKNTVLHADLGNVFADTGSYGILKAKTETGNVSISGSEFDSLEAGTELGGIRISLPEPPSSYSLDLKTGLGTVKVSGQKQESPYYAGEGGIPVKARTETGNITLE